MPSLFVPLTGLESSSEALSVTSNNLANLNTIGFKSQRALFGDLFYQQVGTSGAGDPTQIGLGATVESIDSQFTEGSIQASGVPTDVAIQGDGFFVLQQGGEQMYTRAGDFTTDQSGNLLAQDGSQVMGYAAVNGVIPPGAALVPLAINVGQNTPPQSGMVLLAWSAVDYTLQRQTFEKSLRMTKQEVRQENKDNEGHPQVKSRIRRLRRELMRRSLQKNMQRATAVITNSTHYAVALEYRPATMAAPVVVAKGRNLIAQKIKELARWHEVPIVENPPLAQALYKATEVDQMIPPNLYAAVAEILAFLYRAQMRMNAASRRTPAAAGAR